METRKTRSIYGESIKAAIGYDRPSLKSEDLPAFRPFYVDRALIAQLRNNSNQLIVGRRGTGKTHLLGTFKELIEEESPSDFVFMISIMDIFPQTPPNHDTESRSFSKKRLAKAMFEGFINIYFDKLLEAADARLKSLVKIEKNSKLFEEANTILQRLFEVIETGVPHTTKKTVRKTRRSSTTTSKGNGAAVAASIDNMRAKISASVNAGIRDRTDGFEDQTEDEIAILSMDIHRVRELSLKLLDILKIETTYILIDEWMELDKRTPSDIQPLFAQYLKATFFNSKRFAVKIASVWHETTLYDKDDLQRSRGIQLTHDIIHDIDLDTAFLTSPDEIYDFCKTMLFKRLSFTCIALRPLEREGHVDDLFITEFFDSKENFKAFITASHGIPRDLMDIFHKCAIKMKLDFTTKCISHDLVYQVSRWKYSVDKRKNIDPSSPAQELLRKVNQYMDETGRRTFIVQNGKNGSSSALRKLVDEELIHQIPSSVTPRCIMDTHKAFQIDFGNFVDWVSTKKSDVSELLKETVVADFPADFGSRVTEFEIDVDQVEANLLTCPVCEKKIRKTHPVYKLHNLCPTCGTIQRI